MWSWCRPKTNSVCDEQTTNWYHQLLAAGQRGNWHPALASTIPCWYFADKELLHDLLAVFMFLLPPQTHLPEWVSSGCSDEFCCVKIIHWFGPHRLTVGVKMMVEAQVGFFLFSYFQQLQKQFWWLDFGPAVNLMSFWSLIIVLVTKPLHPTSSGHTQTFFTVIFPRG